MDNFPEKILLVQDDDIIKDYWVLENLTDCKDMEYIRKDVFINKVCELLNNFYSEDRHCYLVTKDVEAFKQTMEEW